TSVAWITPQHEAGSVAYLWCVVQSFLRDIHVPYKNVAHPCAPPCGLYLPALPLRYGAPEEREQSKAGQSAEQAERSSGTEQSKAKQSKAKQGKARQSKAKQGKARQSKAKQGKAR
ncbi:hypothetical protein VDF32_13175, partial [Xanthomonas campestris pv. raphani]|nr:hypothetical protein [Xanthomonas campestris pv. raphani]